jgi:hypothetical protein
MFISNPHDGNYYIAERSRKGSAKRRFFTSSESAYFDYLADCG